MVHFEPNRQQAHAIKEGVKWFKKRNDQVFVIAGFAGTGKTTIAGEIIRQCGLKIEEAAYVAYVGKAAMVLSMRGLPARTIHSLIYECIDIPKRDDNGKIIRNRKGVPLMTKKFILRDSLSPKIKIIVVDEGSMVSDDILKDLLSFGLPVLILGDPHQLPPVFGVSSVMSKPNVILTEIMRQAEDNPIIHFATMARMCKFDEFRPGNYGGKVFINTYDGIFKSFQLLRMADVIICHYNKTRDTLNPYIREEVYGKPKDSLVIGDRLICRENNWGTTLSHNPNMALTNGTIGTVKDINLEESTKNFITFDFAPEYMPNECFDQISLDWRFLRMNYKDRETYITDRTKFEFGYVITCHLSQGSQYDNVMVYTERERMRNPRDYSQWLYTAITRAVDRLIIAL